MQNLWLKCYVGRSVQRLNERIGQHRRKYMEIIVEHVAGCLLLLVGIVVVGTKIWLLWLTVEWLARGCDILLLETIMLLLLCCFLMVVVQHSW